MEESAAPGMAGKRGGRSIWLKLAFLGTAVLVLGLLVIVVGSLQQRQEALSSALKVTQSALSTDEATGKVVWTGAVRNTGASTASAPWVRVTIYDPAGESVDTGEATPPVKEVKAGASVTYTTVFDSRGQNFRSREVLELPNSRSLGM